MWSLLAIYFKANQTKCENAVKQQSVFVKKIKANAVYLVVARMDLCMWACVCV